MNPAISAHTLTLLPIAFISLILPWFGYSRRGILFGVTVPIDFVSTPEARAIIGRYRFSVYTLIVLTLATVIVTFWFLPSGDLASTLVPVLALPFELIVNFFLWRRGRNAVKPHAITIPLERRADLVQTPTTLPLLGTALSLLPLAATALWLRAHWYQIPASWPQHWNAAGVANGFGTRSINGVFGPLLWGACVILLLTAVALFLSRASGPQSAQRRRALVPMAALSWLVAGMLSLIGSLPLTALSSSSMMLILAVYLTVIFAAAFWMMWRSGFAPPSNTTDPYDSTPDAKWYGGIIYYNPTDAAVLVPKRFGWGWTFNFARPTSWVYLAAIVLFAAAMAFLIK